MGTDTVTDSESGDGDRLMNSILKWLQSGETALTPQVEALIYAELRRLATTYMRRERRSHTLQPTALVNEALARVMKSRERLGFVDEHHFYAIMARIMRRVLVDHAKAHRAIKRDGGTRVEE